MDEHNTLTTLLPATSGSATVAGLDVAHQAKDVRADIGLAVWRVASVEQRSVERRERLTEATVSGT